jgi:carboxyl-terminal processing protease
MKNSDVMKRLRGPKGTVVNVKVKRQGVPDLIDFNITRNDIPIYSVDASYMADPTTGYIRVSRFAEQTPKEFSDALDDLRKKGMKNLIIDLQDNGGGYLNAAQELAGMFLKKGDLIVYTDAPRSKDYRYIAEKDGNFLDGRVVVLVNQYSASASEILSGAIQDQDRGVIVGRRTFGKGLVQRPFPFPDGSMIRLTVSRYHTPSGRCIQKPYTKGDTEDYYNDIKHRYDAGEFIHSDSIHFPDSLQYKTLKKHRTVYGGGGIMPDRFIPIDTTWYTPYYRDLMAKGTLYQYTLGYVDANRDKIKQQYPTLEEFDKSFTVTPEMTQSLIDKAEKAGIKFDQEQYDKSAPTLLVIIKALIARDIYKDGAYYVIANRLDPIFNEGLRLINSQKEYSKLLNQ